MSDERRDAPLAGKELMRLRRAPRLSISAWPVVVARLNARVHGLLYEHLNLGPRRPSVTNEPKKKDASTGCSGRLRGNGPSRQARTMLFRLRERGPRRRDSLIDVVQPLSERRDDSRELGADLLTREKAPRTLDIARQLANHRLHLLGVGDLVEERRAHRFESRDIPPCIVHGVFGGCAAARDGEPGLTIRFVL